MGSLEDPGAAVWLSVRKHIRALHLTNTAESVATIGALPAILLQGNPIQKVQLRLNAFGLRKEPLLLAQAMAGVQHLKLKSERCLERLHGPSVFCWLKRCFS